MQVMIILSLKYDCFKYILCISGCYVEVFVIAIFPIANPYFNTFLNEGRILIEFVFI